MAALCCHGAILRSMVDSAVFVDGFNCFGLAFDDIVDAAVQESLFSCRNDPFVCVFTWSPAAGTKTRST